jgi:hypothetical protein
VTNEARLGFNRVNITFTPNLQVNPLDFDIATDYQEPIGCRRSALPVSTSTSVDQPASRKAAPTRLLLFPTRSPI